MNIKRITAISLAAMTITSFAVNAGAERSFDSTSGSYKWDYNSGNALNVSSPESLTISELTIGVAGKSDYAYGYNNNRYIVHWNGVNQNAENNRKAAFKPQYDGIATIKVSSINTLSATAMVKCGDENITIECNGEEYTNGYEVKGQKNKVWYDISFKAEAGKEYIIYPEKINDNSTGMDISSFTFTAPTRIVEYSGLPERIEGTGEEADSVAYFGQVSRAGSDASVGFDFKGKSGEMDVDGKILFEVNEVIESGNNFGAVIKDDLPEGVTIYSAEYYTGE